jgi:hypothetical protein
VPVKLLLLPNGRKTRWSQKSLTRRFVTIVGQPYKGADAARRSDHSTSDASTDRNLGSIAMDHQALLRHLVYWPP